MFIIIIKIVTGKEKLRWDVERQDYQILVSRKYLISELRL